MGVVTVVTAVVGLVILRLVFEFRRDRGLPPGPRRLPFIGNIHQVPQVLPWRTFGQWCDTYGPIISAQFGRQTMIMINDPAIARELLDRRGAIYSDRPRMVMAGENLTKGMHLLLRRYDDRYRLHQRMEAPMLAPRASSTYFPIQDLESKQMLHEFLSSNDFSKLVGRYSTSLLYTLSYGFRLPTGEEEEYKTVKRVMHNFQIAARVGTWIVDAIPILNHLPPILAPWKKTAEEFFRLEADLHLHNMNKALAGKPWNWTKEFAQSKQAQLMPQLEFAYDLGILADAGFETTTAVMQIFVLATRAYPGFIPTAQAELDRVVGPDRLPTFSDKDHLPYINAVVEETLRWRSLAPGGVPHATLQEDTYRGYRIPKGATIVALHWCMSLNERTYENPLEFRPERWLNPKPTAKNPKHHEDEKEEGGEGERFVNFFGYGRRICTGRHIARNSLFTLIARMLWAFDIRAPTGPDGRPVQVNDMDFNSGFVSTPKDFEAIFEPRSERAREVVEREWEEAEKDVEVLMGSIRDQQKALGVDLRG